MICWDDGGGDDDDDGGGGSDDDPAVEAFVLWIVKWIVENLLKTNVINFQNLQRGSCLQVSELYVMPDHQGRS